MQILVRSLHNIDLTAEEPIRKQIPDDFAPYIEAYIQFATQENDAIREYTAVDNNRTVMNCVLQLATACYGQSLETITENEQLSGFMESIALKLFETEKRLQERLQQFTQIQKGSIVQALVRDNEVYQYVIAKVEHSEWYDGETLQKTFGFPSENKKVWKSVVIRMEMHEDVILITSIKVYVNTSAQYWTDDFLEVKVAKDNTVNTKKVFHAVESQLTKLKQKSPQDYYNLRNSIVRELQSNQVINYNEMITRIVGGYSPTDESINMPELTQKLIELAGRGDFDTQFQTDPNVMKRKKRTVLKVSDYVEVLVTEGLPDWATRFKISRKPDGSNYLMVKCDNSEILRAFPDD